MSQSVPAALKTEACPICSGELIEKKLKKFCTDCGQLCETCCDGGTQN